MGQQKFDRMLKTRRAFFDKDGLGYDGNVKETYFKNFFAKSNDSHEASSTWAYCHRLGHCRQFCPMKIIAFRDKLVKSVWIPKWISTSQNEIGKMKWIPKGTKVMSTNTQYPRKCGYPK